MRRSILVVVWLVSSPAFAYVHYWHTTGSYHPCNDTTEVIGHGCHRFGERWQRTMVLSLSFDAELMARHFLTPLDITEGTFKLSTAGMDRAATAIGPAIRNELDLPMMYIATELAYERTSGGDMAIASYPTHAPEQASLKSLFEFFEAVGIRQRFELVTVSEEFATGLRLGHYVTPTQTLGTATLALEPRLRVEVWITPRMTIGFAGAIDVLDLHDTLIAVSLTMHTANYGGR